MREAPWFVVRSHAMALAVTTVTHAALGCEGILIVGERGSGKRRLGQFIHHASGQNRQLVLVDCTAPAAVLARASEQLRSGGCIHTGRCTLLLDRIDRLDDDGCAELVCAIWGGPWMTSPYLQVVATSRRSSRRLAKRGDGFLALLGRLSGPEVRVPALRQRGPDIPRLARLFLRQRLAEEELGEIGLSIDVIDVMRAYDWPGNAIELEEVISWAALAAESRESATIGVEDLPAELRVLAPADEEDAQHDAAPHPLGSGVDEDPPPDELEKRRILAAAEKHGGRRREMAAELDMSPNTLWRRLKELGMVRAYRRQQTVRPP